jgi:SAM-dependent methyltransferase
MTGDSRNSTYDLIAEFYDEDMGRNNSGKDIAFYLDRALMVNGPILELGCGTGRITLPLIHHGCRVDALDISEPMLQRLERKAQSQLNADERQRLSLHCMDMRELALGRKYPLIICPFSAFTYLVEEEDQRIALRKILEHLEQDGRFILDVFVPHFAELALPDDHLYFDYRRELQNGMVLEREKTIAKDLTRQINTVRRTYRFLDPDGSLLRTVTTEERIRYRFHNEMVLLLQNQGFEVVEQFGDFESHPFEYHAAMMVFVCSASPNSRRDR